ncbi:MAG: MFS transporter [Myxococcota bacterium]
MGPGPRDPRSTTHRWVYLAALMWAGEGIYMLPYMRKTFETSMAEAFGITGTELATVNGLFGALALVCYFPGGWLADRFPARPLLTISLVTTGAGGLYLTTFPGYAGLLAVHAFWGVTSILTFWAALIKATREWGGSDAQGRGFGALDAGRGVVAALLASIATYVFAQGTTSQARLEGVLWVYGLAPIAAGAFVWVVLPSRLPVERRRGDAAGEPAPTRSPVASWKAAARRPEVWLLAVVVFAAYWLYLGTFAFPAFAERAHGQSKTFGAVLGTFRDWLRPVAAIGAGLLADRLRSSRVIGAGFLLLCVTFASLCWLPASAGGVGWLWAQVTAAALAVFALRGVYYALMEEGRIPRGLTGTAVGIVSVVGYAPDTFAFLLSASLVRAGPEGAGDRAHFGLLAAIAVVGFLASTAIAKRHPPSSRDAEARGA